MYPDKDGVYLTKDRDAIIQKCMKHLKSSKFKSVHLKRLHRFVTSVIEDGYCRSNAYHNYMHVYEVLETVTCLAKLSKMSSKNMFILQITALCHDIGHVGVGNNKIRCAVSRSSSYDSITDIQSYTSYNEYSHIQYTINLLNVHNIFTKSSENTENVFDIIECLILATDLVLHSQYINHIKKHIGNKSENIFDYEIAKMILILKIADIGHIAFRKFNIHLGWVLNRFREDQDSFENVTDLAKDTIMFAESFVKPMLDMFYDMYPSFAPIVQLYETNINTWNTYLLD